MDANLQSYKRRVLAVIALWFLLATTASAIHIFQAGSTLAWNPPLPLGLAVLGPLIVFTVWYRSSAAFRNYVHSLDARLLTIAQSWRIGGFVFLVLYTYRILPGSFALPAGWGDIFIGATAWGAAHYLAKRPAAFILWQGLGIADLVVAVTMGVLSSPTPFGVLAHGVTTDAMTVLPLSLIPTFAVPLLLIFHVICILQTVRAAQVSVLRKAA